jgi:hypothetical protein
MFFLKEKIHSGTCRSDRTAAFGALVSKLRDLHLHIEREEAAKGEIVVRCLSLPINWGLWRCWSDRILFEVRDTGDGRAEVSVYAIPNLFRISAATGEPRTDLHKFVSQLMIRDL